NTDDVAPGSSNETIKEWDSMQHLNLILALEESFGLEFAPEEIERMLSIEAIASVIEEKLSQPV
ncbi:MAG: acyl carrier protein, partial [Blastocatellia bacterium]|nr:acyl carrier protein [Blastocatellia bacterium]